MDHSRSSCGIADVANHCQQSTVRFGLNLNGMAKIVSLQQVSDLSEMIGKPDIIISYLANKEL